MQLIYRDQSCETSATVIDTIATGETATFMAQPYARTYSPLPSVSSPQN